MSVLVRDPDFTLHVGDVRDVLAGLPDGSVDCVVTSPPYWGLRDYGTGSWAGGDPDCDHSAVRRGHGDEKQATSAGTSRDRIVGEDCRICGATRTDSQIGLEATPELYVQEMVAVFREVRRVLTDTGTCWLNLGDSYNTLGQKGPNGHDKSTLTGGGPAYQQDVSRSSPAIKSLKVKDMVGIPWRVAFALQADGWWLRSDIVWSKSNPMPESVTDRPTKSHEYVFLLTKSARYWFDQEAVREPHDPKWLAAYERHPKNPLVANSDSPVRAHSNGSTGGGMGYPSAGRNIRSVWEIATQPYSEAHFATFPEELARRCILAGCSERVCGTCGKPAERIVERIKAPDSVFTGARRPDDKMVRSSVTADGRGTGQKYQNWLNENPAQTVGWSDCGHNDWRPGVVLDPFMGSGTVALVARKHGRRSIGVELNPAYAELCFRRLQQLSLLAEVPA